MVDEAQAVALLADPCAYFDHSYTAMHAIEPARLDALQRAALAVRFREQRETVPMVAKLAQRQGIAEIDAPDDVVPLLFEHTMYKSYPSSLLERRQFSQLTRWLDKLTSVDLSDVDVDACDSIAAWLGALVEQAQVDPTFSSGTSGTMSFIPWSVRDLRLRGMGRRVSELQSFGEPPSAQALEGCFHHVTATNRNRLDHVGWALAHGAPGYSHLLHPDGESPDLLWLAARLRLAAAKGDVTRVEVPPGLLARRGELERAAREGSDGWVRGILGLAGEPVVWSGQPHGLYTLAREHLERGERCAFAPGSALVFGGGAKGNDLPDDWLATVERFVDARPRHVYGMSEVAAMHVQCAAGRYHVQPWVIPFVLDPDTSEPRARTGRQVGRAAFFDLLPTSHWGGVITGDEIELDFDEPCACGATSRHIGPDIARLSDKHGDDKITCTASPQAHAEAMNYLVGY